MDRTEYRAELRQDLGLTLRLIARSPRFYLTILLVLALGIGANASVFSILQASLIQSLPYRDPDTVVMIWNDLERLPAAGPGLPAPAPTRGYLSATQLLAWKAEGAGTISDLAGILSWQGNLESQFDLSLEDRAERLQGAYATPNVFDLLGTTPLHGRLFASQDQGADGPQLVLSHALWQRLFASDPSVIGHPLTLVVGARPRVRETFTIIGVLRPEFRFSYPEGTEAWALMPWSAVEAYPPQSIAFQAVARRAPDVTAGQLASRLASFRTGLDQPGERPEDRRVLRAEPIREWVVGDVRAMLFLLGGVALLLLLITCVTVANALLARLAQRQRELALRASLGAGRGRLVRQLFTEGATLAVAGTIMGTLLSLALGPVLRTMLPADLPRIGTTGLQLPLFAFAAAAAALTTILAAMLPILAGMKGTPGSPWSRLASGASSDRRTARWRQGLVASQAAITTLLLIGAVLLLASFHRLGQVRLGFDPSSVVTVEMRLLDPRYRQPEALTLFQEQLAARIASIPGVVASGMTSAVPFRGVDFILTANRMGEEQNHAANGRFVDPGYFEVLQVRLSAGRLLSEVDQVGAKRVMVISEQYAQSVFGSANPIGQLMDYDGPVEVVGVVADLRYSALDREPGAAIYLPRAQFPSSLICLVVRVDPTILPVVGASLALQRAVHEIDPWLPAMRPTTLDQIINASVSARRFYTVATSSFAAVALVLTITGLAMVVARVVVERRREMAIRLALGASRAHVVGQVGGQSLVAVVAGVALGLVGAWVGAVLLTPFLYEVPPQSPALHLGVGGLLACVAALVATAAARQTGMIPVATLLKAE